MSATLIGTSHGTDDPAGQAAVRALLDGVRAARPGLDVREAFVDVQQPEVGDVLAEAVRDAGAPKTAADEGAASTAADEGAASTAADEGAARAGAGGAALSGGEAAVGAANTDAAVSGASTAGAGGAVGGGAVGGGAVGGGAVVPRDDASHSEPSSGGPVAVVVPLLLSTGYHVQHDIAQAVAAVNLSGRGVADEGTAADGVAAAAEPLGPHPLLVDILADRYAAAEAARGPFHSDDAVVLAAAGSSVPAAATAVEDVASSLAQRLGRPVTPSYGAGAEPRVPDAVAAARAGAPESSAAPRVIVVSYLLAPGYFLDRVLEAGADVVTDPVCGPAGAAKADPRLVQVVLDRYDAAVRG